MSLSKSQLQIFKEKNRGPGEDVDDNDDDGIIRKADIIVKGIAQESPPFINTCQTNSFLTALRFSFFYNSGNFIKNFRHRRPGPKKIEDAIRVIGTLSKEIEVDPSLIKMAWNTISKVLLKYFPAIPLCNKSITYLTSKMYFERQNLMVKSERNFLRAISLCNRLITYKPSRFNGEIIFQGVT
jgi:hypothetical protein